jgi:hypothetical protein
VQNLWVWSASSAIFKLEEKEENKNEKVHQYVSFKLEKSYLFFLWLLGLNRTQKKPEVKHRCDFCNS